MLCQNSLNVGTCLWHVYPNRWFSGLTSQSDVPTSLRACLIFIIKQALNSRNLTHPHSKCPEVLVSAIFRGRGMPRTNIVAQKGECKRGCVKM